MTKRLTFATLLLGATIAFYFLGLPTPQGPATPAKISLLSDKPSPSIESPTNTNSIIPPADAVSSTRVGAATSASALPSSPIKPERNAEESPNVPAPEVEESLASIDPLQDVEEVRRMVRGFRDALGENPLGNNEEITRALTGGNLKQVKMPVPRGSSVSDGGELVDRWGTPYFFHQVSADEMEVRSAGPDRVMWTADDHQVK